jgi:predicted phosphodiesterase
LTELTAIFRQRGYSRSRKAIERKAANLGVFYKGATPEAVETPIEDAYSTAWSKIVSLKQDYVEEYEYRQAGLLEPGKASRKILCISDFHIPFDRDDLIKEAIELHKDADLLVVNGDMLDLYAVSTWPKERSVILRKEYDIAMEYIKLFAKTFPHVVLTRGNHEYRLNRYFHSNVSKSISFLVNKEILGRLVLGEVYDGDGNIVERNEFKNVHYQSGAEAWFVKIGKTMFVHPMAFSGVEAKTAINAQEYFMERDDIDCVVLAHTHQQAKVPSRNKMCIEQGCLCCPLDYEKQGKLKYKAMTLGYTVLYQDKDGNCDFNLTHNVYLGTQYPIKKDFDEIMNEIEQSERSM